MQEVSPVELEGFRSFINDASLFVRYFGMAMAKSAPHVYISALPFAPMNSLVSAKYSSSFPHTLQVEQGQLSHWPSSEMVISVGSAVLSIALSSDGQRIISGLSNNTVCVWNATTGEIEAGPFDELDLVMSVAFLPDGQHIISGLYDGAISLWNITTGKIVVGSLIGHTGSVWCVASSPDGQFMISGSDDQTICVWYTTTGQMAAGPFIGHTSSVWSVAFSPDGQHIISGSSDQTICVWNTVAVISPRYELEKYKKLINGLATAEQPF